MTGRYVRGRLRTMHRRGDEHPRVVYPEAQVEEMREQKEQGMTYRQIATEHGVPEKWRYVQQLVLGYRRG